MSCRCPRRHIHLSGSYLSSLDAGAVPLKWGLGVRKVGFLRGDIILFLAFVMTTIWCFNTPLNPNSVTRVGLSHAVVSQGTLNIDEVAPYTIDKAHWRGHYYCDKSPGISLLCLPAVYVAEKVADFIGATPAFVPIKNAHSGLRYGLAALACLVLTSCLFSAIAVLLFRRALSRAGATPTTAYAAALVFGFGTPLFIWSTAVFGHATSAALLCTAFCLNWEGRELSRAQFALAGLLLSSAVLVELAALPAAGLIALLLVCDRKSNPWPRAVVSGATMIAAGLPAALVLAVYNDLAFGSPFHLGYASVEGFSGMKSGFFGITMPSWPALWGITFSPVRGIVWLSPILILSLPALVQLLRYKATRLAAATCLGIFVYYLLLNASYHYWNGGFSLGPRHITPAVPFLTFPVALWADRFGSRAKVALAALAILSILITIVSTSVSFVVPDDGGSMLGHLLAKLQAGHSDLVLATLHVPFVAVVAVPLVMVITTAFLLYRWSMQLQNTVENAV